MSRYQLRFLPHFIASSLGTELMYFDKKYYGEKDEIWESHLNKTGFSDNLVNNLVNNLKL